MDMFEHFTTKDGIHTRTIINGKPASIMIPIPDGIEDGDKWSRDMGIKTLLHAKKLGWVQVTESQYMCCYCDNMITGPESKSTAQKPCPCRTDTAVPDGLAINSEGHSNLSSLHIGMCQDCGYDEKTCSCEVPNIFQ